MMAERKRGVNEEGAEAVENLVGEVRRRVHHTVSGD
jgi:hypothetical protein